MQRYLIEVRDDRFAEVHDPKERVEIIQELITHSDYDLRETTVLSVQEVSTESS